VKGVKCCRDFRWSRCKLIKTRKKRELRLLSHGFWKGLLSLPQSVSLSTMKVKEDFQNTNTTYLLEGNNDYSLQFVDHLLVRNVVSLEM